jgi:hypothetical protein
VNTTHVYCLRDTSSSFWSSLPYGVGVGKAACIPDVQENTQGGCSTLKSAGKLPNLKTSKCGQQLFEGIFEVNKGLDCCFNNEYKNSTFTALLIPETDSTDMFTDQ